MDMIPVGGMAQLGNCNAKNEDNEDGKCLVHKNRDTVQIESDPFYPPVPLQ